MKSKLLTLAMLLVAGAVIWVFAMPTYRQGEPSVAGEKAPDFALQLGGRDMHLSDLRGQVVVLNFWASWCLPCVEETPSLNRLQQMISSQGGTVLGVSVDQDIHAYAKFLQDQDVTFPTFDDTTMKIPGFYGTKMYPETYIIGRDGRIARKIVGQQDWQDPHFTESLEALLREK